MTHLVSLCGTGEPPRSDSKWRGLGKKVLIAAAVAAAGLAAAVAVQRFVGEPHLLHSVSGCAVSAKGLCVQPYQAAGDSAYLPQICLLCRAVTTLRRMHWQRACCTTGSQSWTSAVPYGDGLPHDNPFTGHMKSLQLAWSHC